MPPRVAAVRDGARRPLTAGVEVGAELTIPIKDFGGVVKADTGFELGLIDGELLLCDEVLTPDSSRFCWAAAMTATSLDITGGAEVG